MDVDDILQNVDIEDDDDDDDDQLSPAELVQLMEEAWLNEKFSPEILPHKSDIVEILLGQITYIEENLKKLKNTDFKRGLHQMEVDRLRFLISSYLRIRLEKIETYSTHILSQERQRSEKGEEMYLSQNELIFAQEYEQSIKQHVDSILSFCPEVIPNPVVSPNIHSMVFLKSKEDIEGIIMDDGTGNDGELIDLIKGSQVLVSYVSVAELVKKGDVHLI